jgi:3-(3-hydroxy-phenyl)propionate hydroxylase
MAAWIAELPVHIRYGCEVTGFAQDDSGVDVRLSGGELLRARYLVGCDGGRSLIRKAAGIEFPGWDATRSSLIAEVEVTEETPKGVRFDAKGAHGLHRMEDGTTVRVVTAEQQLGPSSEPTLRDLSEALTAVFGTDFGVHSPTWISRFTDMTRQAAAYRAGPVLLAGDAAHVHYPAGGQGLSLGVQDAVNLGWKLAQVVDGTSPESLLDTYFDERHPVTARALQYTMAADGALRVFELLHGARPVLLNLGEPDGVDITPWADRVRPIDASYEGEWELPVLGAVSAPTAVLVRPDGYVAWVGDGTDVGLTDALATWFGPATPAYSLG